MTTDQSNIPPYAAVIIRLLQGVVYDDNREIWNALIDHQAQVREYFALIGVDVLIHESEGFAFLKQREAEEDGEFALPRLIEKRQLGYTVTLLCVLLVEKLIEFDVRGGDSTRLILGRDEIKELVRIFLSDKTNEAKIMDSLDAPINKLVEYGFLRKLASGEDKYEVKRILKAKITADMLQDIKRRLETHAQSLS
ncbi:MAG: DUF4194 domain-containing protein [Nitrospirota bacterium]|nr:DUF4194 domain-containing protein [Nitrospirota bacterium]